MKTRILMTALLGSAVAAPLQVAQGQTARSTADSVAIVRAAWDVAVRDFESPGSHWGLWLWTPDPGQSPGAAQLSASVQAGLRESGVPVSARRPPGDDTVVLVLSAWRDRAGGVELKLNASVSGLLKTGQWLCRTTSGTSWTYLVRRQAESWTATRTGGLVGDTVCQPLTGSVRGDAVYSQALGVRKHFMIYLPASYERNPGRRYPVAYYLHGLSGNETDWLSRAAIDNVADSLASTGLPEAIIVMPDGDDSWYASPNALMPYDVCRDSIRSESPERGCVRSARYADYIVRDLVGYVDAHYRTRADRAHRGIGGLSMGGYGAVKLALQYPDVFAAAASHSGVLSPRLIGPTPFRLPPTYAANADTLLRLKLPAPTVFGGNLSLWADNDPAVLAAQLMKSGGPMPAIYMDVGSSDPFLHENQAFDFELRRLGIQHEYHEYPGTHNWRFWSTHVPQSLAWMMGIIGR